MRILRDNGTSSNGKCQMLYLGWSNARCRHSLGDECLGSSSVERDLGVLVNSRLHVSQQCALADKGTNCILECTNHSIANHSEEVYLLVYLVLV